MPGSAASEPLALQVEGGPVSGLLDIPPQASACVVLAHGAGAGMQHPFMAALAADLSALGIACLRYQFPYMEQGSRRPDAPPRCHATVRAAVQAACDRLPGLPLIAGGKSFGGRMTSQAQALEPLPTVRGLLFLGFPLHPPGKPSAARGEHLLDVQLPLLFVHGTRDEFAEAAPLASLIERLGPRATLLSLPNADHSLKVPARSAPGPAQVRAALLAGIAAWIAQV